MWKRVFVVFWIEVVEPAPKPLKFGYMHVRGNVPCELLSFYNWTQPNLLGNTTEFFLISGENQNIFTRIRINSKRMESFQWKFVYSWIKFSFSYFHFPLEFILCLFRRIQTCIRFWEEEKIVDRMEFPIKHIKNEWFFTKSMGVKIFHKFLKISNQNERIFQQLRSPNEYDWVKD